MGWFDSLKRGISKTAQILNTDVRDLFKAGEILTEDKLVLYHKRLISTDMGVAAADALIVEIREKHLGRTVILDELWKTIHDKLESLLRGVDGEVWDPEQPLSPLNFSNVGPTVILVAGVNGVGKTTSIAKLANLLKKNGKKVVLAAGDTFRAAAVEQLTMWSQRIGVEIVTKASQSDPAAVAHAGCTRTKELNADVLIVDTAGRLHTEVNLMNQLTKIRRVISSQIPDAPHETLLVLDAVTGQNGITQAQKFNDAADCTGIILAKLDGTARGGIVIAIRQQMSLPVKYVGVGEQIDDLQLFNPTAFVDALLSVRS
ncbi:MAG: signal recognition particle-docking protein FtsY [Planctomycetaceae bacterium]|nr:signal recognition particle-docking protein FtsY [Planctomycetaceae bacterium]